MSVPEYSINDDNVNEDANDDDTRSICDSVYSVGEVSLISEHEDDTLSGFGADIPDERGLMAGIEVATEGTQGSGERDDFHGASIDHMVTEGRDMAEADDITSEEEMDTTEANEIEISSSRDVPNAVDTSPSTTRVTSDRAVETNETATEVNVMETSEANEIEADSSRDVSNAVGASHSTMQVTSDRVVEANEAIVRNPGFVLVIDNIDLNVRRSEQRIDHTTLSYHFCHTFALLNRVNSTPLEDTPLSGVLSLDQVLPTQKDLDAILKEFQIFVSRYITLNNYFYYYVCVHIQNTCEE